MKKVILIAAALLCGCVSAGTNYDPAVAMALPTGISKAEAIQKLGQPNNITVLADGTSNLLWMHSSGNALGQGRARAVILHFDAQGHYTGIVSSTQTQIN
jgi:hypothetical protein